jgi:hypothetical protein
VAGIAELSPAGYALPVEAADLARAGGRHAARARPAAVGRLSRAPGCNAGSILSVRAGAIARYSICTHRRRVRSVRGLQQPSGNRDLRQPDDRSCPPLAAGRSRRVHEPGSPATRGLSLSGAGRERARTRCWSSCGTAGGYLCAGSAAARFRGLAPGAKAPVGAPHAPADRRHHDGTQDRALLPRHGVLDVAFAAAIARTAVGGCWPSWLRQRSSGWSATWAGCVAATLWLRRHRGGHGPLQVFALA